MNTRIASVLLMLPLAATAQILEESFEGGALPANWVSGTALYTESNASIMNRGPVFGSWVLGMNPVSAESWTYHDTGVAFQPNTTYTLVFYAGARQGSAYQAGGQLEFGFWDGVPATPFTEPALPPDLANGDTVDTSAFAAQTLVKVDRYTFTTGADVSGMGTLVVFFRNLEVDNGRSYLDAVTVDIGSPAQEKPNILWIVAEDMSPTIGAYGDTYATTPNLDAFAATSLRYDHAWANAPVCSAARSTLITGMYGTTLGVNFHRASSSVAAPSFMKFYPRFLQEAGYYTSNNAKEDYNMSFGSGEGWKEGWSDSSGSAHWRNRPAGVPFFAVFNLGQTHEGNVNNPVGAADQIHDPNDVVLPECHPDIPAARQQWANHHDRITLMDAAVQTRLDQLVADGLDDDTIVFFYSDHGSGMPGYKRYVGNRGQQVALLIRFPAKFAHLAPPGYAAGGATSELVSFVDFAPTLLSLAGSEIPDWYHGRAFAGPLRSVAPPYLFGYADRFDERTWLTRAVHDGRYVYIRNYRPDQPHGLHNEYAFAETFVGEWQTLFHHDDLTPEQAHHWTPQSGEELYDLQTDPAEVRNLADSPAHQAKLTELRNAYLGWRDQYPDAGFLKEGILYERAASSGLYIHDLLQDASHYPTNALFDVMDRASSGDPADVPALLGHLSDTHPSIRHWALIGLKLHGRETVRSNEAAILDRMSGGTESSFWVRVTAAEVIATHGSTNNQPAALDLLFTEGAAGIPNADAARRVNFALQALDEVPFIPESRRLDINTLQNGSNETKNFRRHMWYGYYEQYNNPLLAFRHVHGLDRFGVDDFGNPSGDGIDNLMKFACNLAPDEGDLLAPSVPPRLPPGGTAGLPTIFRNPGDGFMKYQYMRRIPMPDSGDASVRPTPNIDYLPDTSTDLQTWGTPGGTPTVEPIDADWERVTETLNGPDPVFRRLSIAR